MNIFRKKAKEIQQAKDSPTPLTDTPVTTWEEGRKWLKEHGWELWDHNDRTYNNTVGLRVSKNNCAYIRIDVDKAPSDLDAIQQAIIKIETYEKPTKEVKSESARI